MRKAVLAVTGFLFIILTALSSHADMRPYTWAYGYMTPAKGEVELEWWGEFHKGKEANLVSPQVELEYGITDRWVAGLYGVFEKEGADSWGTEIKLEQRYRLFDPGVLPVDTALYLEYAHNFKEDADEFEGKIILSKDIKDFNATLNLIAEKKLGGPDIEYGYAAGISYPLTNRIRPGVEAFGNWEGSEQEHFVGPSVQVSFGKVWVNAGVGFGITNESDDLRARLVVSHELNIF